MPGEQCLAVIRVRGLGESSPDIEKTLKILRLNKNCHITLVDNRPSFLGMLTTVENFVTWGEISQKTLLQLLKKRGKVIGGEQLSDSHLEKLGFKTLEELAAALYNLTADFRHLGIIKPVFQAHPPRKGYKGKVKKKYSQGGVTGYRGEAINELVEKMI